MTRMVDRRWLTWWTQRVCQHPWRVLLVSGLLAVASISLTLWKLEFQPDRNALIAQHHDWNLRFIDWWQSFPGGYDLYVVIDSHSRVDADTADARRARAFIDALGPALAADEHIERVDWGAPRDAFPPVAAKLLPPASFHALLDEVRGSRLILDSPTVADLFNAISTRAAPGSNTLGPGGAPGSETRGDANPDLSALGELAQLQRMLDVTLASLQQSGQAASNHWKDYLLSTRTVGWTYLTSPNDRLAFIRVTPRLDAGALDALSPAIDATRRIMADVTAQFPGIDAGLTGVEVMESDETQAATRDSTIASIVAAVLIALLLIAAFHSVRTPLIAMAALAVGIAWSFGWLVISVGHLQVLSVVFVLILLGLGIDYAIHLASTFEPLRHDHADDDAGFEQAMTLAVRKSGPGIIVGAITTAVAFGMISFTDFRGVGEMGIIAAGGIVLCLISMLSVFIALLRLVKPGHRHITRMEHRTLHFFDAKWLLPVHRHPRVVLAAAAGLTLLSLVAIRGMYFDYDLMALQPANVPSVVWQQRIVDDGEQSIWYGVSLTDSLDEAAARYERFMAEPNVQYVGGIGLLFRGRAYSDDIKATRQALLEDITPPQPGSPTPMDAATLANAADTAGARFTQLRSDLTAQGGAAAAVATPLLTGVIDRFEAISETLSDDKSQTQADRLAADYHAARVSLYRQLDAMLQTRDLTLDDLPESIVHPYIDRSTPGRVRYALQIYPKLPDNNPAIDSPLSPGFLKGFIDTLTRIDPDATGVIMQIYRSGELIRKAFLQAGLAACVVVLLLVWVSFRSLVDALLAMLPVAVGFAWTFAIMALVDQPINPANVIVLPLMFGIGVDHGIHMLHRYRQHPLDPPLGLTHGTGKGITLTTFTTMIGFGAMMLADHRGIASLGFTLTLGMGLTLLTCWCVLPAVLALRQGVPGRQAASG